MEEIGLGILIGLGLSALRRVYRPGLKGAIKAGLTAAEALKQKAQEGAEAAQDLLAEARQEIEAARDRQVVTDPDEPASPEPSTKN